MKTRLNVAALDSILGTAVEHASADLSALAHAWAALRDEGEFTELISYDTSDTDVVRRRFRLVQRRIGLE